MIKNQNPFQLIWELVSLLRGAPTYRKLDIWEAHILLQVQDGDEYKFAFQTTYVLV